MLLEVCAGNYQSAINAQHAGAHRIELCKDLDLDGLTPDRDIIKKVLHAVSLPVYVLIRPRAGNFVYSDAEFETMHQDIQFSKSAGCHGIVSGILNSDGTIDRARTSMLVELSKPLPFTFHRAFDQTSDPLQAMEELAGIGIERVLTSGQEKNAINGIELLSHLKASVTRCPIIIPGAGISAKNATVFMENGFIEIHASARSGNTSEGHYSDPEIIRAILKAISP